MYKDYFFCFYLKEKKLHVLHLPKLIIKKLLQASVTRSLILISEKLCICIVSSKEANYQKCFHVQLCVMTHVLRSIIYHIFIFHRSLSSYLISRHYIFNNIYLRHLRYFKQHYVKHFSAFTFLNPI